jgi:prepilin-type N-terminal cleavage/methylation domain-containing protein/prepilin-type processing-associated H-X9-DG protein
MMRAGKSGFTLLELLIVVVIIAVLLGIVLPSLGRAKQTAGRSACGEQLHAMGVAMREYLNENNDFMPVAAQLPSVNTAYPPLPVALHTQVPAANVWKCPADNLGYTRASDGQSFPSYFAGETLSYEYNMGLNGIRVDRYFLYPLLQDHATYLLADFDSFHGDPGTVDAKNLLYADGHVGNVNDIFSQVGKPAP